MANLKNMKRITIFLSFLVLFILYLGISRFNIRNADINHIAFAEEDNIPVTLKLTVDPSSIKAGGSAIAKLVVTINDKFHIFSLKPGGGLKGSNFVLYPSDGLRYGDLAAPPPKRKFIKILNREIEQYDYEVVFSREIFVASNAKSGKREVQGEFQYQACSDNICLLPNKIPVSVILDVTGGRPPSGKHTSSSGGSNIVERLFVDRGIFTAIFLIFISGLALNLTPCVYPMIPVTISFFGGQTSGSLKKNFLLALMYVLGMAVVYSIVGVTASLTGSLFGSLLQNKWVLVLVAGVFIALALSMFGLYEFMIPGAVTSRITMQKGYAGSFITGSVVGIVAAPCIGPFVLALIVFVGHLANPVLGFLLFFVFSIGLGLPYLFLGTFSSMLATLPKSGEWLNKTKKVFGTVLLGMALYYLKPVLPPYLFWVIVSLFLLAVGTALALWKDKSFYLFKIIKITFALLFVIIGSAILWVTISTGGNFHFKFAWNDSDHRFDPGKSPIQWVVSMEEGIAISKKENKPILVDFYSFVWCPACIEFEKITYRDSKVVEEMKKFVNVKIDVDKNPETDKLREKYGIKGIPTILFFDSNGNEISSARVAGFQEPELFLKSLEDALHASENFKTNVK